MRFPANFPNPETYFQAVAEVLSEHRWLYNFSPTELLVQNVMEQMPTGWAESLLALTHDERSQLPSGLVMDHWPASLKDFVLRCSSLKMCFSAPPASALASPELCQRLKRGLTPKKQHEVRRMAALVHEHCRSRGINKLLDMGSGLGYLGQLLHHWHGYQVLGLESRFDRVHRSYATQLDLCPNSTAVKSITFQVSAHSAEEIQAALCDHLDTTTTRCSCGSVPCNLSKYNCQETGLEQDVESSERSDSTDEPVCVIALHACGDLSVNAIRIFLQVPRVRCLIVVPCCYHLMSLTTKPEENSEKETFNSFPMSESLKKVLDETAPDSSLFLRRFFLRLSSQATAFQWKEITEEERRLKSIHLVGRAVLQLIAKQEDLSLVKRKRRGVLKTQFSSFETYIETALSRFDFIPHQSKEPRPKNEIRSAILSYWSTQNSGIIRLAEVFTGLQTMLQGIVEQMLIVDRIIHIKEQSDTIKICKVVNIMEELVSPRCMAIVAER